MKNLIQFNKFLYCLTFISLFSICAFAEVETWKVDQMMKDIEKISEVIVEYSITSNVTVTPNAAHGTFWLDKKYVDYLDNKLESAGFSKKTDNSGSHKKLIYKK